jgi:hypothetical protein
MILDNYILKLVSMSERPAQRYSAESKKWEKIEGATEKYFEYIFVSDDEFRTKVVLSSKQDFTKFENKRVNIVLDWKYDDFKKAMRQPSLADIIPAEAA